MDFVLDGYLPAAGWFADYANWFMSGAGLSIAVVASIVFLAGFIYLGMTLTGGEPVEGGVKSKITRREALSLGSLGMAFVVIAVTLFTLYWGAGVKRAAVDAGKDLSAVYGVTVTRDDAFGALNNPGELVSVGEFILSDVSPVEKTGLGLVYDDTLEQFVMFKTVDGVVVAEFKG